MSVSLMSGVLVILNVALSPANAQNKHIFTLSANEGSPSLCTYQPHDLHNNKSVMSCVCCSVLVFISRIDCLCVFFMLLNHAQDSSTEHFEEVLVGAGLWPSSPYP